jgi:hypothetical protein
MKLGGNYLMMSAKLPFMISYSKDGGKKWNFLSRWDTEEQARKELATAWAQAKIGVTFCLDEVDADGNIVRELDAT